MLNIGKILNLLKNLTDIQKGNKDKSAPNLICLYSADSNYLNNFYLWDLQEEKGINFYQYFNKFRDSQIDIYEATYKNLITFLNNSFKNVNDKDNSSDILGCEELFSSLKEREIAVTIRDLLFLKEEILGKFQKNINEAKIELVKYSDIIPPEEVDSYFYFWNGRIDLFLLYLYTKSVYEIDPYILSDLKFYSEKTGLRSHNLQSEEARIREIKDKHSFIFKHLNLEHFWEDKYNLIEKLIHNQNDTKSFSRYIFDSWKASIIEKIKKPDFHKDNKFPEIVNRLFSPLEEWYSSVMYYIIRNISNNLGEDRRLTASNFFDNYIQIIKTYIPLLWEHNWKDTEREEFFIYNTIKFFWIFTDTEKFPIVNIEDPDWSLKEERSGKIKTLLKEIQKNDNIVYQFMFLYLILRTHSSCSRQENKDLQNLVESFSPSELVNDEDASIINLTRNFLKIPSNISCDDKVFIETLSILLYDLIHREWKDLPLLKRFWEEHSLLLLIYSMIYNQQSSTWFLPGEQDEEQKECYTKIYQELLKSQRESIKPLIKKLKNKILIKYKEWQDSRWATNTDFLSNLEDKISIEDISDSLNSFYWQDNN